MTTLTGGWTGGTDLFFYEVCDPPITSRKVYARGQFISLGFLRALGGHQPKAAIHFPPQQHGGGTGTLHRSFVDRTQCHSRRAPAGTAFGLGVVLGSPGFTGTHEKSWEQ